MTKNLNLKSKRLKKVFLAIGTNKGNRKKNIEAVLHLLQREEEVKILKVSSMLKNPPQEGIKTGYFLNGAIKVLTLLSPRELLKLFKNIERHLGRSKQHKDHKTNRPRVIDLDILFYEDKIIKTKDLIVPHPRLHLRDFVLIPMMEIGKDFVHPVLKKKIFELYMQNYCPTSIKNCASEV